MLLTLILNKIFSCFFLKTKLVEARKIYFEPRLSQMNFPIQFVSLYVICKLKNALYSYTTLFFNSTL